ncbi:MAG: hypothetical protein F4X12_13120 [Acidobacteriia bacterium]|nr:hypothetical protein [Terriglobia bacterium]
MEDGACHRPTDPIKTPKERNTFVFAGCGQCLAGHVLYVICSVLGDFPIRNGPENYQFAVCLNSPRVM